MKLLLSCAKAALRVFFNSALKVMQNVIFSSALFPD
jgi:hypothetical protein